jgi:hypothetical protein
MTRFLTAGVILGLAIAGEGVRAQTATPRDTDAAIEQLRKDTRADVTSIITGTMEFSTDEAAKFWPLYKTYEKQRTSIGDEKVALIKDYAAAYSSGSVSDEKAKDLLTRAVAIDDKATAAKRGFLQELQKALPGKTVAKYYMVQNRIELLANLALAEQIPIIK